MSTHLPSRPATATATNLHEIGECLKAEIAWLSAVIDERMHQQAQTKEADRIILPPPPTLPSDSSYGKMLAGLDAFLPERLMLALALAPQLSPTVLDVFLLKNAALDRGFTEFGGARAANHTGFLPTGETALFLLCGSNITARLEGLTWFDLNRPVFQRGPLRLATVGNGEPPWSGMLSFSTVHLQQLIQGRPSPVELDAAFPARRLTTTLEWEDLVLDTKTLAKVGEIKAWAQHRSTLLHDWNLAARVKPGYCALFHGLPGTGKALTAALLGKVLNVDVYQVDLAHIGSSRAGETEKNLARVLAEAERRNWILYFDEADALFGKRTAVEDAHDRYASLQIAGLLQRLEDHPGIIISATQQKPNLDEGLTRRCQSCVAFAAPDAEQRQRLWQSAFGTNVKLAADVDLAVIAQEYTITPGQIASVVRRACLQAVQRENGQVTPADIREGIRREVGGRSRASG